MTTPSCPNCGAIHSHGARFCSRCGTPVAQETAPLLDESGALTKGVVLAERYEIRAILGRGGFSIVYGAIDRRLNVPVAVKQNMEADAEASTQFIHEAQLMARLRHPSLVRVIDYFVDESGQFLVMEYVHGRDLEKLMNAARGALPVQQVVGWGLEVCDVLDYLHSQTPPVIHRDIKPANLKLNPNGTIIVIDLGIAKVQQVGQGTVKGALAYSSGYSPLEQHLGKGTDQRSDIYALGATLYHLLSGTSPPEAPDRIEQDEVPPLLRLRPDIPPGVAAAVESAITLRMEDRPASARLLKQQLERGLQISMATPLDVIWPGAQPVLAVRSLLEQPAGEPPEAEGPPRRSDSQIWPADQKEMVYIDGGPFMMGSDDSDADEQPRHRVDLPPYLLDRYPVTNAEYANFVAETSHPAPEHWTGQQLPAGLEDHPVVGIAWDDARAYAEWAGKRLPTEAEWEKAARCVDSERSLIYPWGDEWDPLRCNSKDGGAGGTVPVGAYSPQGDSPCGVGDMAGNSWEWTSSLYRPYPYKSHDGREDPAGRGLRVVRGGSWSSSPSTVRTANRNVSSPANVDPEIGFRCAADSE